MSGIRKAMAYGAALASASVSLTHAAPGDSKVVASLVASSTALAPGSEGLIGVHLKMEKGWHVYWRYAGDSGAPLLVDFDVPEGVTIGEPMWPAPERYIDGGVLVNYVYHDEVTLLFPVMLDAAIEPGTSLTIDVDISWLVCKEYCFPGGAEASLTLRAGSDGDAGPGRGLIEQAEKRLPRAWKHARAAGVGAAWSGGDLVFEASGASELAFYPYPQSEDVEVLPSADMLKAGTVRGERLVIGYGEDARDAGHVLGVLRVDRGAGKAAEFYEVDIPGPGRAPGSVSQ